MPQNINTNTTLNTLVIAAQKAKALAVFQSLVDGINTELADVTSYVISGKTYTKADLLGVLQGRIDAGKQTLAARTAMHLAVANEQSLLPTALAVREGVKLLLAMRFGKESPMLQKFGYAQRKTTQTAAVTTAEAVQKSKATRAARGTTGKKAKSLVKGASTAAPPPTTAAPSAPTASPPAPAAPAATKAGAATA